MIIIRLTGGLGNQLFQYAFARSLSYDLKKKLYIDISNYNFNVSGDWVIYGLQPYNIKGIVGNYPLENYNEKSVFYHDNINFYEKGGVLTLGGFFHKNKLFDNIEELKFPAYFNGYYCNGFDENENRLMTEKFFKHNRSIIKEDLTYCFDLDKKSSDIKKDMENHDSIALHIRRGDYKNDLRFGTCSPKYYTNAIEKIVHELENPKFYVFTQDENWVRNNIKIEYPHMFVDVDDDDSSSSYGAAKLLTLMSSCNHFIISNSTFSWWGAWLSKNKNKQIITPRPWMQSREILEDDTIDDIKPIFIENIYEEVFENCNNTLFKLENIKDVCELTNIDFENENNAYKVMTNNSNASFKLRFDNLNGYASSVIIKFSLKTANFTSFLRIYYQTIDDKNYDLKKSIFMWYYKNEEFNHYLVLPDNVIVDSIKISPAPSEDIPIIIKDIEVREFNEDYKAI